MVAAVEEVAAAGVEEEEGAEDEEAVAGIRRVLMAARVEAR